MIYWLEIFLIGAGLSMDALAVSIALGTVEREGLNWKKILLIAFFFGFFQAVMPLAGCFGSSWFVTAEHHYERYVAAGLLWLVGGKMIRDRHQEEKVHFGIKELTVLAFATSIDAFLTGVSFACLGRNTIFAEVLLIGVTTFLISAGGCIAGRCSGRLIKTGRCILAGGLMLIAIGLKIAFWG
ncbi:MAG: manganese efflux pump [Lentisphaeria bacterium]|nr:manganese efflux pump [Lentisphaeria bacterium]